MTAPALRSSPYSRWAFALSTALVCATFPLIWLGGLVTSASAGMSVPDWPTTFGYNMFLYPWESWIYGPRSILFEHGHRLLGSLVGMLTLGLAFTLWRTRCVHAKTRADRRLLVLGLGAIPLVILQGVLGGLRVVENKQLLALIHGCVGPAFFAYAVMLWQLTSRRFREATLHARQTAAPHGSATRAPAIIRLARLAWITTALCYLQLVFGALVRHTQHMPDDVSAGMFRGFVHFHLFLAGALTLHIVMLVVRAIRMPRPAADVRSPNRGDGDRGFSDPGFGPPAALLALAIVAQLALGAATWVVQFNFPQFVDPALIPADFVVRAQSFGQLAITTAHVAVGSLILVTSLVLSLRASLASRLASVDLVAGTVGSPAGSAVENRLGSAPGEGSATFASGLGRREAAAV